MHDSDSKIGTAQTRMQDAISKVEQWAKDWGVTINESKTASMLFSLSTKPEQFRLKVKWPRHTSLFNNKISRRDL